MDTLERVSVYIDGSNFYKYLKNNEIGLTKGTLFNYKDFVNFVAGKRQLILKKYYVGIARNYNHSHISECIVRGQQKFLANLENDKFIIGRGRIMYDSGKIREKGTDVHIAVDIVADAFENAYDTVILISSDTDLIPAIQYAKKKGKKIEYVGFSHAPSFGMQKYATRSLLLRKEDIEKFIY